MPQFANWVYTGGKRGDKIEGSVILPLHMIQAGDESQVEAIFRTLRDHPDVVHHYLLQTIFPKYLKSQVSKLTASGQELGSGSTLSHLITYHM
jgi:hypothetical protein